MASKAQHTKRYRPLPALLRQIREEAGFTQRALGDRLGRPQSWIHNCEVVNRRVDVSEFCEWCTACGIDPSAAIRRYVKSIR